MAASVQIFILKAAPAGSSLPEQKENNNSDNKTFHKKNISNINNLARFGLRAPGLQRAGTSTTGKKKLREAL